MRVLYVAHRHDPTDPMAGSGADAQFYAALIRENVDVRVLGPFLDPLPLWERLARRISRLLGLPYTKFPISLVQHESAMLTQIDRAYRPDVIFTLFPLSLVGYPGSTPCVYRADAPYSAAYHAYEPFRRGILGSKHTVSIQAAAFRRSARVITHSEWSRNAIIKNHRVGKGKVCVFPNPAALPSQVVPVKLDVLRDKYLLCHSLRLLFVGRVSHLKGLDIAIEVISGLNAIGIRADLTVCGTTGSDSGCVKFVGLLDKRDPVQLRAYANLYRTAHLLLHPARFDSSPIVTSEAAAFGVPTITNDVGGMATSVKHGESGIVLAAHSPAKAYVEAIAELIQEPERYYRLCETSRQRYERDLNWGVAGKRLVSILRQAAHGQDC